MSPERPHDQAAGATPLTPEEREGLLPSHITTRNELNELEQQNIIEADVWAFARKRDAINESLARGLHRRMFGKVWRWAGRYRTSDKNLGVPHDQIHLRLYETFDNTRYWAAQETYAPDEIAVRFHHALVAIHPFPNGNGRWSRLMADILTVRLGQKRFTWGSDSLRTLDETRHIYIEALQRADHHDFIALLAFVWS